VPLGGDIVLSAMGIKLEDETSFQRVRSGGVSFAPAKK